MESNPFAHAINIPPSIGIEDLNAMLRHMVELGGSDLFLMGGSQAWIQLNSRMVRITRRELSDQEIFQVLMHNDIYGANAPSRLGGKDPINTSHEFVVKDGAERTRYRFRVNAVGCLRRGRQSVTMTLRTIPTVPPTAAALGIEADILRVARGADQGLILVTGATGNGKSTLLGSLIRDQLEAVDGNRNVVTIEAPIEFVYDDVEKASSFITQMEVDKHINDFHEGVKNAMRMAPTTILIGEARDYETVSSALEASVTGHVVYSTVHTNSVPETFQRLVGVYPESLQLQARLDILQALKMVITQRLIPTVDGKRTAIREYLVLDQAIKDRLAAASNLTRESFAILREFGRPMAEDAREKFAAGVISQETLDRQLLNYDAGGDHGAS
ncbi:defect-in-organelle-trafficking protein DotB [Natronocella acetinitrilica]|uniref:Defect-in-organelle-trafficking protein DotB n=1 Tax=Natronocella acetinitrilica TaxID=414046 RepID=A0AAE3KB60_9GAMM|nr:ATPase, T2SS/T4P/T4SS family [Natronocella acetinitrilica]MCP1674271.1 defect-in-organelle-trafficking protein DotB [Natronocella acetinitrilica]